MIKEAIILAGGLGTRLRSSVPDLPKCMAPVAGKPFLDHVITYLKKQSIESFIFSLGYKHEVIEEFIRSQHPDLTCKFSLEQEPLGTGGAIQKASGYSTEKNVIIINGDTLFSVNLSALSAFHLQNASSCTLALKPMKEFERYGSVEINKDGYIQSFREKQFLQEGLINGGVYALNIPRFLHLGLPEKFSFEKDYLEKYFTSEKMMGLVQDEYFIDIGIPEDFERANRELGA